LYGTAQQAPGMHEFSAAQCCATELPNVRECAGATGEARLAAFAYSGLRRTVRTARYTHRVHQDALRNRLALTKWQRTCQSAESARTLIYQRPARRVFMQIANFPLWRLRKTRP
jgi:hypothetical protein